MVIYSKSPEENCPKEFRCFTIKYKNLKFKFKEIKMPDKIFILVILVISFSINAIKFISLEGSDKPLPGCLFNMIINLLLIILLFNEKK